MFMAKKFFLFFGIFGIVTLCSAQTRIHIDDASYKNVPLRIYAYKNLLTRSPVLITEKKVNENGKRTFNIPLSEAQLLYIPIYSFKLIFYAEPNKEITLQLPDFSKLSEAFVQLKSYSKREIPLFVKENNSLNQTITSYDKAYNSFLKANFNSIYNKGNAKKYDTQIQKLKKLGSSAYFKTYTTYKEAYVSYVAGLRNELLPTFFAEKSLQLHNTAYVSLLRKLAKEIATEFPRAPSYRRLYGSFLNTKSYSELDKIGKGLAKTSDKKFNEHFLIYVLYLSKERRLISQKIMLQKLQLIAKQSPHKKNKQLAKSIIAQNKGNFKGQNAPKFSQKASNEKTYSEDIFKSEKPTIVAFFDGVVSNDESISTLEGLQKKHKNMFNVVVFSCEKGQPNIPENWTQFVIPYYSYILKDYRLGRFPYYVLVEKDGKIGVQTWQQYLINLEE